MPWFRVKREKQIQNNFTFASCTDGLCSMIARKKNRGISLVEIIIAAAILVLVFGGLFGSLKLMLTIIGKSKIEAGALALTNERMEYIRSLQYNNIGTVGGIPGGNIPQNSTTTLNNIVYSERILIEYIDDDADGTGASDSNGILADYKRIKVEYSWSYKGVSDSISLISNIVPKGIESTAGGGSIRVNVFDASVQPLLGASVHLYNDTTTSTVDVARFTDVNGIALFSGAPAAANYEVTVTDTGYSTDKTYIASPTNPNPNPPSVAVLESEVSTMNFSIDQTSTLTVHTIGVPTGESFVDTFPNSVNIATFASTTLSSGSVVLLDGVGSYEQNGTVQATTTEPNSFDSWTSFDFTAITSASTSIIVQLYEETGLNTYVIVPDVDLPGNSTGFTSGPIDISSLNTATYSSLTLVGTLTTTDNNFTPSLEEWRIDYVLSKTAIGNIPFTLSGNKSIGTLASGTPILKYQTNHTTDGLGEKIINNLEWDVYDMVLNIGSYDIAKACDNIPYVLSPGQSDTLTLTLVSAVTNSLRVYVANSSGGPIIGASVNLSHPGVNESDITSVCGQVFFNNGLSVASDYQVDVSAPGFTSESLTGTTIDGVTVLTATLSP